VMQRASNTRQSSDGGQTTHYSITSFTFQKKITTFVYARASVSSQIKRIY